MHLSTLITKEKWPDIIRRIKYQPDEVKIWDNGYLPIHRAFRSTSVPTTVIDALIRAYPVSLQCRSLPLGLIPLHSAVRFYTNNIDIINILLEHYPDGAAIGDVFGQIPLLFHLRESLEPSLDVVKILVNIYPQSSSVGDHDNWYPLHDAARRGDWSISKYLLESYPRALMLKTQDGRTPYDVAYGYSFFDLSVKLKEKEKCIIDVCEKVNKKGGDHGSIYTSKNKLRYLNNSTG